MLFREKNFFNYSSTIIFAWVLFPFCHVWKENKTISFELNLLFETYHHTGMLYYEKASPEITETKCDCLYKIFQLLYLLKDL
jgi:hypothetical protein